MRKVLIALFVFVPCMAAFLTFGSAAEKGDAAKGKESFQNTCVSCHGPEGKGDGVAAAALNPKPRNLTDAAFMSTQTDDRLYKVVNEGGASVGLSPMMAAWGGVLSKQDIWNVIAYIRQDLCKCQYNGK
jgi:mono/diheme cytochrome c family protein